MAEPAPGILLIHKDMSVMSPLLEPHYQVIDRWQFADDEALVRAKGPDIRVIATHGGIFLDPTLVEALPNLGLIAAAGAGYDGVDVVHARSHGVEVVNGAGANAADVADFTVALLLAAACEIKQWDAIVREGRWQGFEKTAKRWSVHERRVGIVGLGWIGAEVAQRLAAFNCPIAWYGPRAKPDARWPRIEDLTELARQSDILVVTAPYDETTHHLIDRNILDALGPRGILVNVARGGLVDEDALIEALKDGRLGGAALDVQKQEPTPPEQWKDVPNLILTPHMAGYATGAMVNLGTVMLENLRCFFAGEPLRTRVR